ncbi:MAG: SpoIID/LytB domain-containing protein [Ruminococcaceae bacterium]|nr:SpoIID/LytB domain-containing protein [Oscillospiraceae bacterium]
MSKDVKLEILYYKTNADVALEFGLHGDYPLRLLSIGSDDMSQLLHNLKRAISRSEIIIIVGALQSRDNLTSYLAKFIGRGTETGDNGDYGILEPGTVTIPAGAYPLVTKGKYGGFVIESGPQTIFALNEDRDTRLRITEETLVPYITEHHRTFGIPSAAINTQKDISATPEFEPEADSEPAITPIIEEPIAETESATVETVEQTAETEAANDSFTSSILFSDSDPDENGPEAYNDLLQSLDFDEEEENLATPKPIKGNHKEIRFVRVLCIVLASLVLLCSVACAFFDIRRLYFNPDTYYSELAKDYNTPGESAAAAFERIKKENNAFFTWLSFTAAGIDHPVMSVNSIEANKKFLKKLPNGWSHESGSLISTTNVSPNLSKNNTVIYGNAENGGIFSNLKTAVLSPDMYSGYSIITADSRYQSTWSVFSVFTKTDAGSFDFTKPTDGYENYLNTLRSLSRFENNTEIYGNEILLILVGVQGDENYVVVASLKQVRVLSESTPVIGGVTSDTASTGEGEPDIGNDKSDETNEPENDDFQGDSPDIEIELPPVVKPPVTSSTPASSAVSSTVPSTPSSTTSSTASSNTSTESSKPPVSSSAVSSATPSKPSSTPPTSSVISSTPSSVVSSTVSSATSSMTSSAVSSNVSSEVSSVTSSEVTSSGTTSQPDVDPIFTWDKEFTITDSSTGIKYTAKAVDMVAMIIEDEMSPTIDPAEALIAQAIVKYNWLLHNNGGSNALDPNPTPQAKQYAEMAKGSLIMYGNTVAKTYCFSYSAGKTANYHDIWGGGKYAYLVSVDCPVDETNPKFETVTVYSSETIRNVIKDVCGIDVSDMDKEKWLVPTEYDDNGVYCTKIKIGGKEYKGTYLRNNILTKAKTGQSTIRSSAYKIQYNEEDDTFTVTVRGYGHGVGLSQYGAKQYAKQGWTHEQIIAHFFPGTTLVKH